LLSLVEADGIIRARDERGFTVSSGPRSPKS